MPGVLIINAQLRQTDVEDAAVLLLVAEPYQLLDQVWYV